MPPAMADPRPMPWGDTDSPKAVKLPHSTRVLGIRRIVASCHMAANNMAANAAKCVQSNRLKVMVGFNVFAAQAGTVNFVDT